MFNFPDAKRVRRDELVSPTPSSAPLKVLPKNGYERLRQLLDYDPSAFSEPSGNDEQTVDAGKEGAGELEQEFDFRLFAVSVAHNNNKLDVETNEGYNNNDAEKFNDGTRKLQIYSPSPEPVIPSEGRFVVPYRGWQYYFTTSSILSDSGGSVGIHRSLKRREYEGVAVTGEQLLNGGKRATWPGCHLPWRVIRLNQSRVKSQASLPNSILEVNKLHVDSTPTKLHQKAVRTRKKPGKKRRIVLRNRAAADNTAKITDAERRNRKNRERKIKRRQKERERKAAMAATVTP